MNQNQASSLPNAVGASFTATPATYTASNTNRASTGFNRNPLAPASMASTPRSSMASVTPIRNTTASSSIQPSSVSTGSVTAAAPLRGGNQSQPIFNSLNTVVPSSRTTPNQNRNEPQQQNTPNTNNPSPASNAATVASTVEVRQQNRLGRASSASRSNEAWRRNNSSTQQYQPVSASSTNVSDSGSRVLSPLQPIVQGLNEDDEESVISNKKSRKPTNPNPE